PGVLAAFGLLAAAIEHHHARTWPGPVGEVDLAGVNRCLAELDEIGRARMRDEGVPATDVRVRYSADMRYVGQAYELEVPIRAPRRSWIPAATAASGRNDDDDSPNPRSHPARGPAQPARRHRRRDGADAAQERGVADREGRARRLGGPVQREGRDDRAGGRDSDPSWRPAVRRAAHRARVPAGRDA